MTEMRSEAENPFQVIAAHQKSVPVNVDVLARDLGIKIYRSRLGDGIFGKLVHDQNIGGPSGYAIFVNSDDAPVRQRFTTAHEIAHFVLHRDLMVSEIVDHQMYRSNLGSSYETQANRLAADILMPAASVRQLVDEVGQDPAILALRFQVSPAAMEIRLQSLRSDSARKHSATPY